jgi:hypothetical protein
MNLDTGHSFKEVGDILLPPSFTIGSPQVELTRVFIR